MAEFPTLFSNQYGLTSDMYTTNEQPIDMYGAMFENYPEVTPLTSILTRVGEDSLVQSTINWIEQEEIPTYAIQTAAQDASTGTLTFATYAHICNHDLLFNTETFELVKVETYTTRDTTVDVVRGFGGTSGVISPAGSRWEILLSNFHEAADEAQTRGAVNTYMYNYTTEVVEFVRTSKRAQLEKSYFGGPGSKRLENQAKQLRAFKIKFEKTLWFSYRDNVVSTQTGSTTHYQKSLGGIVEKLRTGTNYIDVAGIMTESILESILLNSYNNYPDVSNLLALCSPKVYGGINRMAKSQIRISPNEKTYGLKLNQYQGAINIDILPCPTFVGPMSGWMFLLDLSYVRLFYQQRPQLELDVYTKRAGYVEDKYSAFITMMMANEKRHTMVTGITG